MDRRPSAGRSAPARAGRVTASRLAAFRVLRGVRGGELADPVWEREAERLPPRERGWTQELAYGTLRLRGRLDWWLGAFVRAGLDTLEPDVLDVLRLGAYQVREMRSVPPYAAVSQSVELARALELERVAGLVNGVLQSLVREGDQVRFPDPEAQPIAYLESWGSHPRWLLDRWADRWGLEDTRGLVEADNRVPELYLRPIGVSADRASVELAGAGISSEIVPWSPDSVLLRGGGGPREALAAVPAVVQDPAASLVVRYAAVPPGARVLDLCAAPGGKTAALAEQASWVGASDISADRLGRVRENVERLGLGSRVEIAASDARFAAWEPADLVLLDVPCTGTGTLRRHPDARWRVVPDDLDALGGLQAALLDAGAARVRPGGRLVYSTCSLEPEENERQVRRFLERHPEFRPDPPRDSVPAEMLTRDGWLLVLPQRWGADGAFAARLQRAEVG